MVLIVFIIPKYGAAGHHLQGAQLRGFKTQSQIERLRHNNPGHQTCHVTRGSGVVTQL